MLNILAIGCKEKEQVSHGVPNRIVNLNDEIWSIATADIKQFHCTNGEDFHWGYFPLLFKVNPMLSTSILTKLCQTLIEIFPDQQDVIQVLKQTINWKYQKEVLL